MKKEREQLDNVKCQKLKKKILQGKANNRSQDHLAEGEYLDWQILEGGLTNHQQNLSKSPSTK